MSTPTAVLVALVTGGLLTFSATRATATVYRGRTFLRLPVVVAF